MKLSPRYFLVELCMGLLFAMPFSLPLEFVLRPVYLLAAHAVWLAVIATLFLMALIDMRHKIIPDEIHIILIVLGIANLFLLRPAFAAGQGSFLPDYALLFGLQGNIWVNHIVGALFGVLFFALLIVLTRGRGMGVGDAKLGFVLGLLFGWPDIVLVVMLAFVLGAIVGVGLILQGTGRLKQAVPFGPFLGISALFVMLFGNQMLRAYFSLFGW
jgi:prepilin signal peptidase PulO-like enzyme (type II secretory pathway)